MGLGPRGHAVAHPHPEPTAEEDYLHDSHPISDDFKRGDREHQLAAPRADVLELPADLVPQIPWQDEDVVGPRLGQALGRVDRDVRAWEKLSLLDRAAVDGVGEQIRSDAAVVEQGVALARAPRSRRPTGRLLGRIEQELARRSLLIFITSRAKPACPSRVWRPAASSSSSTALTRVLGSPALSSGRAWTRSEPP